MKLRIQSCCQNRTNPPEGYWKLNSAVVKDKRFRRNFKKNYAKVSLEKENYDFPKSTSAQSGNLV